MRTEDRSRLEEIRGRLKKGTRGQWTWKATGPSTAEVWVQNEREKITDKIYTHDADFIANARTDDIPYLLDLVEGQWQQLDVARKDAIYFEKENARLREALEFYGNKNNYLTYENDEARIIGILEPEPGSRARTALRGET